MLIVITIFKLVGAPLLMHHLRATVTKTTVRYRYIIKQVSDLPCDHLSYIVGHLKMHSYPMPANLSLAYRAGPASAWHDRFALQLISSCAVPR